MTLRCIIARFWCDGCGKAIPDLVLDPATENISSLMDAAENALKDDLHSSVQWDLHLCGTCTNIADNIHEDPNVTASRDEILEALEEQS